MRSGDAKVDGKTVIVTGVDANVTKVINITWASGSSSVPAELGRDGAFLVKRYADDHSLTVGSPLTVGHPPAKSSSSMWTGSSNRRKAARPS